MLVVALHQSSAWLVQPASPVNVRPAAALCIDEFETLQMPLFPLPGWKAAAREEAITQWTESRKSLLAGSDPHCLLVALRNEAEAGRYFEGVDDGLLGFAEIGLLPAPPEKNKAAETSNETPANDLDSAGTLPVAEKPQLYPYLANLAVRPGARKLGLGGDLVSAAEAKAVELGYDRLYVKVKRENFGARRLYDRNGYSLVYLQNRMPDLTNRQTQFLFLRKDLLQPITTAATSEEDSAAT